MNVSVGTRRRPVYGHKIKERVDKWVGIPVSVGIAPTKTLAKIGTHIAKKSGIGVYQMPEEPSHILAKLPLEEIWGIGSRLACKLRALGIKTAGELAQQDTAMIRRKFSVCLARTILELNGQPALEPEELETKSQSICCSRALGRKVTELAELREAISTYTAWAAEKMRKENQRASGVNIFVELGTEENSTSFSGGYVGSTVLLKTPQSGTMEILHEVLPAIPRLFEEGKRYRKAGVLLFGLADAKADQLDLFAPAIPYQSDKLYQAIDAINAKLGRDRVRLLVQGLEQSWRMKRQLLSPRYTTQWQELPQAK